MLDPQIYGYGFPNFGLKHLQFLNGCRYPVDQFMKYSKQLASEHASSDNRFYWKNQHISDNLHNDIHENCQFQLYSV